MQKLCACVSNLSWRVLGVFLAVAGAFSVPALTYAQDTSTPIELDSSVSSIDIVGGLSSLGSMLSNALVYGIGLAAAIWGVIKCWQLVRRGFGR